MSAIAERPRGALLGDLAPPVDVGTDDLGDYRLRMSKQGAEAFGAYLAAVIAADGRYADAASFARAAGISPSAVSRYINGKERPAVRTLPRLAQVIGTTTNHLVDIAYPEHAGEGAEPAVIATIDPLVAELAAMLAEDSPLSAEDRQTARTLVDRVIEPYRKPMRRRR